MKKLMIAAAIVCAAAFAQAAQVNWSANNLVDQKGVGLADSTYGDFTVKCFFYSDATGASLVWEDTGAVNAMGTASGQWTQAEGVAASTTYYAKMVITDKTGATLESEVAQFTSSAGNKAINFAAGSGFATTGAKIGTTAGDWSAAPEPTSGLLLLLGVASLALKRRRA